MAINSGMDVTVREPEVYPVQVQGPKSKDTLVALFGPAGPRHQVLLDADDRARRHPRGHLRTGWTGEVGYEIYLRDPSRGAELWDRIMDAGRPHGIRPIAPCEARRIEAGIFNYGSDMTIEDNPFHVMGLERLVEAQEADYIGKAALEDIRAEGRRSQARRHRDRGRGAAVRAVAQVPRVPRGEPVGTVTDLIWSPRLERNIGYVWVPIGLAGAGNPLEIEAPDGGAGRRRTAAIPFLDPRKDVPKS